MEKNGTDWICVVQTPGAFIATKWTYMQGRLICVEGSAAVQLRSACSVEVAKRQLSQKGYESTWFKAA